MFVGQHADMTTLAEISDKMLSIPQMWALMALLATPFLLGMMARWLAWTLLPIALAFSALMAYNTYWEAFVSETMSHSILTEIGLWWAINSVLAPLLPSLAAVAALTWVTIPRLRVRMGVAPDTTWARDELNR